MQLIIGFVYNVFACQW